MRFRHIIIPTSAMPAINSLPKPSPLELIQRSLVAAVTLLVLSQKTTVIDRILAEDLAAVFEVSVDEIPSDVTGAVAFIYDYMDRHLEHESTPELMYRLQVISQRLRAMMIRLAQSIESNDE